MSKVQYTPGLELVEREIYKLREDREVLLEALRDLVDNGIGTEAVKRARDAIAKATGAA